MVRLRLIVPLVALVATACTYTVSQSGDGAFLTADLDLEPGRTTLAEAAAALGPPDVLRRRGDEIVLVYRFRRKVTSSLVISYYLNLLTRDRERRQDATLILTFDRSSRLLHHGLDPPGARR